MPRSSPQGKKEIGQWLAAAEFQHKKILDIGVGQGTYHNQYARRSKLKGCAWYGVEVWAPYIDKFSLKSKYSPLINEDARTIDYEALGLFDVAFCGDVLEHMTKEDAISLVAKLEKVATNIIISIPIIYMPQGGKHNNPFETHVKPDWTNEEVLNTFPSIKESLFLGDVIGVYRI